MPKKVFAVVLAVVAAACDPGGGTGSGGGTGGRRGSGSGGVGTPGTGGSDPAGSGGTTVTGSGGIGTGGNVGTGGAAGDGTGGSATGGTTGTGGRGGSSAGGSGGGVGTGGAGGRSNGTGGAVGTGGVIGTGGVTGTGGAGGGAGAGGNNKWCLPISAHPMGMDWGKALIDSRRRAGVQIRWVYEDGLWLHGVYLAYKRLGDAAYLSWVKSFVDANINGLGSYNTLDNMQPTILHNDMFRETKDMKYVKAPAAVATRLETTYPKTSDGGFWHFTTTMGQLWGDGVFMNLPTYVSYGELQNHPKAFDVAAQQLVIYDKHLIAPNNLHKHNWDETVNRQSCCEWCRAEGWYEMSLLLVLDKLPTAHPDRDALIAIVQKLAKGVAATQDAATGRWWQVMDRPMDADNWLETSCSSMHTYFLSKASEKGYIDAATYAPLAIKGFMGVMQQASNPSDVRITNICPGTGVLASPSEYYARPKATNDQHGLGAFLMMYDQLTCR